MGVGTEAHRQGGREDESRSPIQGEHRAATADRRRGGCDHCAGGRLRAPARQRLEHPARARARGRLEEAIDKGAPTPPKGARVADPRPAAPQPPPRMRASAARSARWPQNWIDWLRIRRNWMTVAGIVFGLILLLVLGTFAYAYATLPDPNRLDLAAGDVKIVDRHGTLIEQRNAQGVRVIPVKKDEISPNLRNATIAVEDKHFYQHHGVDWGRVIKAGVIDVITRKPQQGASTITEQLAKIAILQSPQKTILRKLREAMLASALESRYTKDEILTLYLNSIYYGHHATGIEAAAEVYFGKHAKDLTLGQASLLAGLPNGPSYYDPALHKDRATARQAVVLEAMVNADMI